MLNPGDRESFIGVFLENIVYGIYFLLSIETAQAVAQRGRMHARNKRWWYTVVTMVLIFILVTLRCIIDTIRCVVAFKEDGIDFGPPNAPLGLITNSAWFFLTAVADAYIVHRTYVVWKGNWWVIIVPTGLFLANFGSSIWLIVAMIQFDPSRPVFVSKIITAVNTFVYLTLFTNVLCTGLISYRVITVRRRVAGVMYTKGGRGGDTLTKRIVTMVVESAAIYTALLIGQLITNRVGSYINYIIVNCTSPTIGIVFSYIIVRVSRGAATGDSSDNTSGVVHTSLSRDRNGNQHFELNTSRTRNNQTATINEVQVKLERVVHQHRDIESGIKEDDESNLGSTKFTVV
ncbi:hypothetical protein MKEN_00306600 [Mycena kentingensis (nom. inval.)]|nr:hypothetical protein MKEN_00306600 [Mycena kentingensis (nom. inval.)]